MVKPKGIHGNSKIFGIIESSLDYIIECVFSLAYSLFITPYKLKHDFTKGNETKIVAGSQWKKITSLILTTITAITQCIATNSTFSRASIRSPKIIFKIAPDVGDTFLCFMFWYVIWRRKNDIDHFFSLMKLKTFEMWRSDQYLSTKQTNPSMFGETPFRKVNSIKKSEPETAAKISVILFCTVLVFFIVAFDACKMFARFMGPGPNDSNAKAGIIGVVFQDIRQGLFMDNHPASRTREMTSFEFVLSTIYLIFQCYFMFYKAFAIVLCMAAVMVVYKNSIDLNKYLNKEVDQLKVIQGFEAFREFVESINEMTGPIMFGIAVICAPTFYVANLSTLFISFGSEAPITWLTMSVYGFILLLSAEVTHNTDEFCEWILEFGEGSYEEQLFANFVDLSQNPVGMRGLECFTVTHTFLAQMLSAVVTFTIILLQFQAS